MKISKKTLLVMSGMLSMSALWLMFVSATDDKNLFMDVNNAIQHIPEIKIVSTGNSNNTTATIKKVGDNLVWIDTDNFILWQTWDNKNTISKNSKYSSILWWIKNKIQWNYNVIIWGSWNNINEQQYNTIVWWENNTIDSNNKWYNTIAWWKNNKIENSSYASVIVWGHDNTIHQGKYSVVMWNNSSVKWTNSVALWSWAKINASNSFLWTDGENNEMLKKDDVFVVMARNWAVINSDKAHTFAKLTLWWPLILSSSESQTGIVCEWWQWWWIIKIEKSDNNQLCLCSCDGSGWNSMFYKGRCLSVCNQSLEPPKCGSTVDRECTSKWIIYSWSCENWLIIEWTWSYFVDKNNIVHRSCQTNDGQVQSCSGSVNTQEKISDCIICPEGSTYNKSSKSCDCVGWQEYIKETNTCRCPEWTIRNGVNKCVDKIRTIGCVLGNATANNANTRLPENAEWVNSWFTQTWNENSKEYEPSKKITTYDPTGSEECSFKCKYNFNYVPKSHSCVPATQTWTCTWLPQNAEWRNWLFTQTRSGSLNTRYPLNKTGSYIKPHNFNPLECTYTCQENYQYIESTNTCEPNEAPCKWDKPEEWSGYKFWSGTYTYGYTPTSWSYTSSSNPKSCEFTCNKWYTYKNKECIKTPKCWSTAETCDEWEITYYTNNYCKKRSSYSSTCVYTHWKCKTSGKNSEIEVPCECETTPKPCPEGYSRDSKKEMCKFTPRFCMVHRIGNITYYYPAQWYSSALSGSVACFNEQVKINSNYEPYTHHEENSYSTTDKVFYPGYWPNKDSLGLFYALPFYYDNNTTGNYLYPETSLDIIDWRVRYYDDYLGEEVSVKKETLENFIKYNKENYCKLVRYNSDNYAQSDVWMYLDCDFPDIFIERLSDMNEFKNFDKRFYIDRREDHTNSDPNFCKYN